MGDNADDKFNRKRNLQLQRSTGLGLLYHDGAEKHDRQQVQSINRLSVLGHQGEPFLIL